MTDSDGIPVSRFECPWCMASFTVLGVVGTDTRYIDYCAACGTHVDHDTVERDYL